MAKHQQRAYPLEYWRKLLQLIRSGRSMNSVAEEYGVARQTLATWVKQADLDSGKRSDGLTTDDQTELAKLRRRVRDLEMERDILKKAAAWFARETKVIPDKSSDL